MKNLKVTIQTNHTKVQVIDSLKKGIISSESFWNIFSDKLVVDYKFKEDSLNFSTYQNPPIIVNADVVEENQKAKMDVLVRYDSLKKSFISGIYGFLYPILFVIALVYGLQNSIGFWFFFWVLFFAGVIYFGAKILVWWEYQEPNPDEIVKKLAKIVQGEIIEKRDE